MKLSKYHLELLVRCVRMLDHSIAPGKGKEKSQLLFELLEELESNNIHLSVSKFEQKNLPKD